MNSEIYKKIFQVDVIHRFSVLLLNFYATGHAFRSLISNAVDIKSKCFVSCLMRSTLEQLWNY